MPKYFTLGSYSISILHYSLYHWDKREVVFLRPIRAYENWLAAYYGYQADNQRMYDIWWRRIEDDPDYLVKFGRAHQKNFKNLNTYLDIALKQTPKADKRKMLAIFNRYWRLLFLSQPIGDINLNIDEIYLKRLAKNLKKFLEALGQGNKFSKYLIDLTTPWKTLITMKEDLDFLQIVWRVKQAKADNVTALLKKHLKKYEWIPCWYDNAPWALPYLRNRLNSELKISNLSERIQRLKDYPRRVKTKARRLTNELRIKGTLLKDLAGMRAFTYIRTEIDLHTGFVVHRARPLYVRLAELLGLTFEQLKFLTPEEIRLALRGKLITKELVRRLKPRQKFAVQIFNRDKQKILVGKKARQFIKKVVAELNINKIKTVLKDVNELKGIGASLGTGVVKGLARVIGSIAQLATMKEGEVLVVPSTSVDYVAAMKKAAAIVTEVGGLTCHAAIVSRELGKPCVVNTLSATKVFKTGDLLEVDAKRGVVRTLRKK